MSYHPDYRTKHVHTGLWGKESIEIFKESTDAQNYKDGISVEEYDFYTDYSNSRYLVKNFLDLDKNETDEILTTNLNYEFK